MGAEQCRLSGDARVAYEDEQEQSGGWYGCALPNLLSDGYLVERVSARRDDTEQWRVTLRLPGTPAGFPRTWHRAYLRYEDGETRALLGDAWRHTPGAEADCARALHAEGWADRDILANRDKTAWLVIAEKEDARPG